MERRRAGRCRLTLEIHPCGSGEGFDVDAACGCGLGWAWIGWDPSPARAADEGATQWAGHASAVTILRRRGPAL